jgi:hypothetical protein
VLQPRGLIPGTLSVCPYEYRKPRDRQQYLAACAAAEGNGVAEHDAAALKAGMQVWCRGGFVPVGDAVAGADGQVTVLFADAEPWTLPALEPVYCLTGALPTVVMH